MAKTAIATNFRLPNAPLAEVVFELRWKLVGDAGLPPPLHTDPGLIPALSTFTTEAAKLGFNATRDMSRPQETGAFGVVRRYFRAPDQAFPLLQLGPGIFASNQSSDYYWESFKRQTLDGARALLASYPILEGYPLTPVHLELRYIDVFDKSLLGTTDLSKFLAMGTTLHVQLPPILDSKLFGSGLSGRLLWQAPVRGQKNTIFSFDIGSGTKNKEEIVRLQTKVLTTGDSVPKPNGHAPFIRDIARWLDMAHDVTSPFFKAFVTDNIMKKFSAEV